MAEYQRLHGQAAIKIRPPACPRRSLPHLAQLLGITKRGVEELMHARKIPFLALGYRTVRFDWEQVRKALAR